MNDSKCKLQSLNEGKMYEIAIAKGKYPQKRLNEAEYMQKRIGISNVKYTHKELGVMENICKQKLS